jgi:hypothetical protein
MVMINDDAPYKDGCVQKRKKLVFDLPAEVLERLDGLFPRERLEEALVGLAPDEITRPGGLLTVWRGGWSRRRCVRS